MSFADEIARMIEQALRAWRVRGEQLPTQLPPTILPPATGSSRGGVRLSDDLPEDVGAAAAGASSDAARADHVHGGALSDPTTTEGDLLVRGASALERLAIGNANEVLTVSGGAVVWAPGSGGGGGAPTDAAYVTTAANGDLTNELVIPGFAAHADRAGAGGAGFSEEFNSTSAIFTWTPSAPDSIDYHTTLPSHCYMRTTGTTERFGYRTWSPSGNFDIRWKISSGRVLATDLPICRGFVANSDNTIRLAIQHVWNNTGYWYLLPLKYSGGTWSSASGAIQVNYADSTMYLRITRTSTNTITWFFSHDGLLWTRFGQENITITVARAGVIVNANNASGESEAAIDWMRANV